MEATIRFSRDFIHGTRDNYYFRKAYDVDFINEPMRIRKTIVDKDGMIQNFPGIEWEESWKKKLDCEVDTEVRYGARFEGLRMIWHIQPDGRFWEDEWGFGAEDDPEISLYADLDEEGNFTGPFRIFSIDAVRME